VGMLGAANFPGSVLYTISSISLSLYISFFCFRMLLNGLSHLPLEADEKESGAETGIHY